MARILVVDDDEDACLAFAILLRSWGKHEVVTADDGGAALRMLHRGEPFDLIVSDCQMRLIGGVGLLLELKATPQFADMPIMLHSGDPTVAVKRECAKYGVPFTVKLSGKAFADYVENVLRQNAAKPPYRSIERIRDDLYKAADGIDIGIRDMDPAVTDFWQRKEKSLKAELAAAEAATQQVVITPV